MKREEFTMAHTLRVRWAEVDRQDVVFNGNYFTYFDVAVAEYWRAIGVPYPDGYVDRYGSDVFAVKATAEYHGSARYDELLEVGCRAARIGRSSLVFQLGIWRADKDGTLAHLTSGELVYVNADVKSHKSVAWPDEFKAAVLAYERTPPELAAPST